MRLPVVLSIFWVLGAYAQIDNESNFYTAVANANYNKDFVIDYGADNSFATDDSTNLQTAIDDVNANGGGTLTIPAGNYSLSEVNLKSNVHLDVDDSAVIRPSLRADQGNYGVFSLGENTNPIENVSITSSSGGRFTIDLTQNNNPNVTVIKCKKVTNFLLSDFDVDDVYTKFSVITMGGESYNTVYTYPTNGIVKNIDVQEAHYGYGTVQTQSAENILFKNLSGTGGATLRLETGFSGLNNLQGDNLPPGETKVGGLNSIVARNISSTDGNCAVMVSPHAVHNGTVDVEGVTSVNSGFAVRLEGGFVDQNKYDLTINLTPGTFEYVRIKDVTATYGSTAEVKSKHFKHYPPEISNPTTQSSYATNVFIGPSIAGLLVDGNYLCDGTTQTVFIEEPITANGFTFQPTAIVPSGNVTIDCGSLSISENNQQSLFEIYPNPTSGIIDFSSSSSSSSSSSIDNGELEVFNVSGVNVKRIRNIEFSKVNQVNLTELSSGMYFIRLKSRNVSEIKKIIIE